jgi:hypothetical protein
VHQHAEDERMSATATPPGASAGRPRRRWPAVGWVLAAAGVLAVLLAVVFVVPRLLYPPLPASRFADVAPDKRIELETNRLKLQNDARATLLQALAGGVLLLGAYFTYRQLRVTREGQITDRYTKAVDQLGSGRRASAATATGRAPSRVARASGCAAPARTLTCAGSCARWRPDLRKMEERADRVEELLRQHGIDVGEAPPESPPEAPPKPRRRGRAS